jgi:hypothetical protein
MQVSFMKRIAAAVAFFTVCSPILFSQNTTSIQLFGPVDVRLSAAGTGFGANAVVFNSSTINLTCPSNQTPSAVISSTADGTGNVIVDNDITVQSTIAGVVDGPTNVCVGGVNGSPVGPFQNCFTSAFEALASPGQLNGADPDNYVATGGIPPIDISSFLTPGAVQLTIDEQDEGSGPGFYLSASTLYLDTNCTQGGVTGPAVVTGNPIPASGATNDQLAQDFSFNPTTNQSIGFTYDLTEAQAANTLTIQDGTIPFVFDAPLDPAVYQSTFAPGTSFATSSCLLHSGELLPSGAPACKLYTLQCAVGTEATSAATGAQCPISSMSNEVFQDTFDGPAFTLSDIPTPGGPTFHEGIGLLMANDSWTGGPCTFDPAADLPTLPCPQNLLTSFSSEPATTSNLRRSHRLSGLENGHTTSKVESISGVHTNAASGGTSSGTSTSSGRTTHPNSTFITVAQVPEDLTSVTVEGQNALGWINTSTANVTLSSQPPNLAGTTLPNAATFVASPIQSITYGISPAGSVPVPGTPVPTDTTLLSGVTCPTLANPTGIPASTFTAPQQSLSGLADGQYAIHYYAQDCAGTQELKFTQDNTGVWSTNFYTYAINVDTTPPVANVPTLSPAPGATGTYVQNQPVTASFSCTDALSGVVSCGGQTFPAGTNSTGTLTAPVNTASIGNFTYTVTAIDAAGNQSTSSVPYQVVSPYDSQIAFSVAPTTVSYPSAPAVTVKILPLTTSAVSGLKHTAMVASTAPSLGTIEVLDGTKVLETLKVPSSGSLISYLAPLSAGQHSLSISYSGNAVNPSGISAPIVITVLPGQPTLYPTCTSSSVPLGQNYDCAVLAFAPGGAATGVIEYQLDGGKPVSVPLFYGIAGFQINKPAIGPHTLVISYPAQPNFLAAPSKTETFTVVPLKSH